MGNEFLDRLNPKSVWVFTKQDTSFDEGFKAAKLLADVCGREDINVEEYFTQNHKSYGIHTNRHRMLVLPQLYGLITKTPFYGRGGQYTKERPTLIYDLIKDCEIGDAKYNTVKTEQLLKLKIHAIIDTANNNEGYNILPVLFIYRVLKDLKDNYGIGGITVNQLYTYVLTCKSYDEAADAVKYIKDNAPVSGYVSKYKDVSRVMTAIKNNLNLFVLETDTISLNPVYDGYFQKNFAQRFDFDELHGRLYRDVDYSYFLYNYQGFGINLINEPDGESTETVQPLPQQALYQQTLPQQTFYQQTLSFPENPTDDEYNETEYESKIDSINERNFNEDVANDSHKTAPVVVIKENDAAKSERNPLLGKIAIKKAYYSCERNHEHQTFISNKTQKQYMEAHHLVPFHFQKEMWAKYKINIDCIENLVSLCPTCHKTFHYGTDKSKAEMIHVIYDKVIHKFKAISFDITADEIKQCYGIKK
jgi:hypothetical protein